MIIISKLFLLCDLYDAFNNEKYIHKFVCTFLDLYRIVLSCRTIFNLRTITDNLGWLYRIYTFDILFFFFFWLTEVNQI